MVKKKTKSSRAKNHMIEKMSNTFSPVVLTIFITLVVSFFLTSFLNMVQQKNELLTNLNMLNLTNNVSDISYQIQHAKVTQVIIINFAVETFFLLAFVYFVFFWLMTLIRQFFPQYTKKESAHLRKKRWTTIAIGFMLAWFIINPDYVFHLIRVVFAILCSIILLVVTIFAK